MIRNLIFLGFYGFHKTIICAGFSQRKLVYKSPSILGVTFGSVKLGHVIIPLGLFDKIVYFITIFKSDQTRSLGFLSKRFLRESLYASY